MMKRVDATHVAMDPDSVFPFSGFNSRRDALSFVSSELQTKVTACVQMCTTSCHTYPAMFFSILPSPHFFISKHPHYNHAKDKEDFMCYLTNRMKERKCSGRVMDIEIVKRKNIYLYHENDEEFMKITLQFPVDVPPCRDILHTVPSPFNLHA